jgi:tRNA(Ile)-lysidine synthase
MLENLVKILQDECQIHLDLPIVAGVSGGPDSLCLLDVLNQNNYQVVVAHFNHKLRPSADDEAEFVHKIAHERGLKFLLGEGGVTKRAERESESLEQAARYKRYRFLFRSAESVGAQAVVVGHSADDQVETVLMHLLRGAGLDGLSGMHFRTLPNEWSGHIPLLRPLLSTWRSEILDYCHKNGLDPIFDDSNEDTTLYRNRLRHELIPYLETYNPAVRKLIWRTAEVLKGEKALIVERVDAVWEECLLVQGEGYLGVDSLICSQQPLGVQRHVLRKAIAKLRPGLRDVNFNAIENAMEYIHPVKPYAEIDLIAGLRLVSEPGKLWIAEWGVDIPAGGWPQVAEEMSELKIGDSLELKAGWRLSAAKLSVDTLSPAFFEANGGANRVWVDYHQIQLPLIVRSRRDGDRLQPFGLNGHSLKLSKFMINEKVPRRARGKWPLVCSGKQIVWVPGYRIADSFRVTDDTTKAVRLELSQKAS